MQMELKVKKTTNMNIKNLKTDGFVSISYPNDLRMVVNKAIKSWKEFCKLETSLKQSLPYSNGADGVGYEFKDGSGNKGDRKENFDLTLSGNNWLKENIKSIDSKAVIEFIEDGLNLVSLAEPLILDFAKEVEREFSLAGFSEEVSLSRNNFFFRFIHYFPNSPVGVETATAHVDQSGFTLHLFESDKGLECLDFKGNWVPMPVSENQTVIINSMQLQLRSKGELKALAHRVISNKETEEKGRYSLVCFVQLKNTPKYNKNKFGRLQEKDAGFNYKMSFDEFKQMFT